MNAHSRLLDGGFFDIYDGTQPATADDAPGSDTHLLASLQFGPRAFAAAVNGVAAALAILSDPDAARTGTATWYRLMQADHLTAVEDGSVGRSNANLVLNSQQIQQHAEVSIDGFVLTASKS